MSARTRLVLGLLLLASPALAQPAPEQAAPPEAVPSAAPSGPAEVLGTPRPAEGPAAELPPGHAPVSDELLRRALGEGPPIALSQPSAAVPPRTVEVQLVDENGLPLAGVRVRLGSMVEGRRDERFSVTDGAGRARFTALPEGARIAYRASLDHEGARTVTAPFTLSPDRGQAVFLRRLGTTRSVETLLQRIGQTVIEWKTDRLHVSQAMDLMNLGDRIVVFGDPGFAVPLPEGFLAFEAQASMNDQRLVPDDQGFRLQGSLPPGRVELRWSFDLPLDGDDIVIRQPIPFDMTAVYRVIVDASAGMSLRVTGFPDARWAESDGRRFLYTEAERSPQDPPFGTLRIRLSGVPAPGPWRYVVLGLSAALVVLGIVLARRPDRSAQIAREEREQHRRALLEEAGRLAVEHSRGEVGEVYFERERARIVDELAMLAKLDADSAPSA